MKRIFTRTNNTADLKAAYAEGYEIGEMLARKTIKYGPLTLAALIGYKIGRRKK